MKKVTLIPGDGVGPELAKSVQTVFQSAKVPIEWEICNAGQVALDTEGELIPKALLTSIEKNKVALKSPITTPVGKGFKSVNVQLRQHFDLYKNLRPCKSSKGINSKFDVDLVLFRENTEGLYSGLEIYDERLGIADSIARVSKNGCERIIKGAFDYAQVNNRKKVTLVHKANILKMIGKVFLEAGAEVAKEYPNIEVEDKIIDNMCMQLVIRPETFDVVVTTNLFGDILSDLCAGLVGGLGVVAGANIGNDIAIFEAVHGSAPDIAGKNVVNPTALLRSSLLMLDYLKLEDYKKRIENALNKTIANKTSCTQDLGGNLSTTEFTKKIIENLN